MQDSVSKHDDFIRLFLLRMAFYRRRGYVAVISLQAALDESGTHKGALKTLVGGYLFEPEKAAEFHEAWDKRLSPLRAKGVTAFHARDCAKGEREFLHIGEPERKSLFYDIAELTKKTAEIGFLAELDPAAYAAWRADNPSVNAFVGTEYASCCFHCLLVIRQLLQEKPHDFQIHYSFEQVGEKDKKGKGHLFDRERDELFNAIARSEELTNTFRYAGRDQWAKGQFHPVEAADLLLWTYYSVNMPLTPYTKIARGVFRKPGVRHVTSDVTYAALTYIALLNANHEIKEDPNPKRVQLFKI